MDTDPNEPMDEPFSNNEYEDDVFSGRLDNDIPEEALQWNWGAFGFTVLGLGWIWTWRHKIYGYAAILFTIFLIHTGMVVASLHHPKYAVVPKTLNYLYWIIGGYFGRNGSRLAWDCGDFHFIEDFTDDRRNWGWWAFSIMMLGLGFVLGLVSFFIWLDYFSRK